MNTIFFLIAFATVVALALLFVKADAVRDIIVYVGAAVIAAVSIYTAVMYFNTDAHTFEISAELASVLSEAMMVIEIALGVVIFYLGCKYKKYLASLFALIGVPLMTWFELKRGHEIEVNSYMYVDRLSVIMILIIGIVGSLICVYATAYMKDFVHHHPEDKDRRTWFFFLMFIFLAAMFGVVTSNNLTWMYFYWEITSLCSFFLIGYTKTEEAINNSFRALIMNLFGGLAFAAAIIYLGTQLETLELSVLVDYGIQGYGAYLTVPVACLALAGITKAAQMPFSSWLLGAMVAPTPTSALLHSSTMVKAGVFLILKLAPCLGSNVAGIMVMIVGGITFLMASFAAISQSNGKRVLAYSTVSNLGLIVACAGVGSAGSVWAATMLIIFHAITKSLLFLCVGTAEHNIGSRDIEDMDGLFGRLPRLAGFMMVGISAMFLAPLGMLVAKWASMVSFVDSGNMVLVAIICFGSAATAFYWTKWLGKLSAVVANRENIQENIHRQEWFVLGGLVGMVVAVCLVFPLLSSKLVVPYLMNIFQDLSTMALSQGNMYIMTCLLALVVLLPLLFFGKTNKRIVPIYMAGVNKGDNLNFENALKGETEVKLRNWYMSGIFNEKKMNLIGNMTNIVMMAFVFVQIIGGVAA